MFWGREGREELRGENSTTVVPSQFCGRRPRRTAPADPHGVDVQDGGKIPAEFYRPDLTATLVEVFKTLNIDDRSPLGGSKIKLHVVKPGRRMVDRFVAVDCGEGEAMKLAQLWDTLAVGRVRFHRIVVGRRATGNEEACKHNQGEVGKR